MTQSNLKTRSTRIFGPDSFLESDLEEIPKAIGLSPAKETNALTGLGLGVFVSLNRSVVAHYDDINPYF